MLAQQVAKKYSTALFNLVMEKALVDQAFEQFEQLDNVINSDKALVQFLLAPHILEQDKISVIREVFGSRLEPLFLEFLLVLIDKHRIGFLHDIIEEFRERVAEARGIIVARIVTALPMDDTMRTGLIAKLRAKTGKTIDYEIKSRPGRLVRLHHRFDSRGIIDSPPRGARRAARTRNRMRPGKHM